MDPKVRVRIRRRAYKLWEQEGRPEGRADVHWFQAELAAYAELATAGLQARR